MCTREASYKLFKKWEIVSKIDLRNYEMKLKDGSVKKFGGLVDENVKCFYLCKIDGPRGFEEDILVSHG